jgi:hypothetical protein
MDFNDALIKLGIEEYSERIFNSNSKGELFHLNQYIHLAKNLNDTSWFYEWFKYIVKYAEENWERPESIFQHIITVFEDHYKNKK